MKKILLVHDHQESPAVRKGQLEASGYEVSLAPNGADAIARVERERPTLVLMDVLIDGANGFDVCRRMRAKWKAHELPIILTSGVYRSRWLASESAPSNSASVSCCGDAGAGAGL